MIKAGQIAKGMFLLFKNEPHLVVERDLVSPGKGAGFVRMKLRNIKTGLSVQQTNKTQDSVEECSVEYREAQYMYSDAEGYHFMDNVNYEQFQIPMEGLEERKNFLKEGETYQITIWEQTPIDIKLPTKMVFKVTQAEKAEKGDTVSGAKKPVVLETGFTVRVPLFIKEGDKVLVNTETGEYQERVNG
jgi:elongation factor P